MCENSSSIETRRVNGTLHVYKKTVLISLSHMKLVMVL